MTPEDDLLPPTAAPGERALADAAARALERADADAPAALWDPDRCPPALLAQLAASVDAPGRWPDDDAGRRRAIRGALALHRRRGTPAALRWSLRDAGVIAEIVERPGAAAHTVSIGVLNSAALDPELRTADAVRALAERTGRASVVYQVSIAAGVRAAVGVAAAAAGVRAAFAEAAA